MMDDVMLAYPSNIGCLGMFRPTVGSLEGPGIGFSEGSTVKGWGRGRTAERGGGKGVCQ